MPAYTVEPAPAPGGLAVILAIDHSLSMTPDMVRDARRAAVRFIQMCAPGELIGLVSFAGELTTNIKPTSEWATVGAAIERIEPAGYRTALYDAAFEAVNRLAGTEAKRKAVILLTDGKNDTTSPRTRSDVERAAQDAGVCIQPIGLGNEPDAGALSLLASNTSGSYRRATDSSQLVDIYEDIAAGLHSGYVITFSHKVEVAQHELTVRAHRGDRDLGEATMSFIPMPEGNGGGGRRLTIPSWVYPATASALGAVAAVLVSIVTVRSARHKRLRRRGQV
jgi:hypothetical protein